MNCRTLCIATIVLSLTTPTQAGPLSVDFNSTTQDAGPHNQVGFQPYNAGHEVSASFTTQSFSAFGTIVTVTPSWPNTTDNRVQQMIDRNAGYDANWSDVNIDLVTDFLGIDTRTMNGGNGYWDGTVGTPTYMTLALGGLPAGVYSWMSFHHDTENIHGYFQVELSTDGGSTYLRLADGYMSDSTPGGTPDSEFDGSPGLVTDFAGMFSAGSVYQTTFIADGASDVVFRYAPYSGAIEDLVHNRLFGINGFELTDVTVPEPASSILLGLGALMMLRFRRRR